ncbi:MAG TPA: molybdopterin-dependent oxidoreductase, partial [Pilimelia sp.]|nr:molybdopterin-dependent oxidoreductase [Pilimelia sp.]
PRRAEGLPPGQRLMADMPRFTDRPRRPPPRMPARPTLRLSHDRQLITVLTADDLEALRPSDYRADFHCVTTWSVTGLTWTGVPLRQAFAAAGITAAPAPYLVARAGDHGRAVFCWEDATADDVILATHLNGAPLDARHGAPLRLVSPRQYGYKSLKHLVAIDFRAKEPRLGSKEHLRARVAAEERHARLPGRALRVPYRLLIPATAYLAERSLRRGR